MADKATLVSRRGVIKSQITRLLKAIQSFGDNGELYTLKARREKAEEAWQEFQKVQEQLEILSPDSDEEENYRAEFEDTYFHAIGEYDKLLELRYTTTRIDNINISSNGIALNGSNQVNEDEVNSLSRNLANRNSTPTNGSYQSSTVRLAALNVPEFNGDYTAWSSFSDMYRALIHSNEALNNVQKFFYLKAALTGDAAKMLQGFDVTEKNYQLAWECLNERYNNKRILVQTRIKSIFDLEHINNGSSVKLRNFVDALISHLKALESLGYEPYSWGPILLHVIAMKMDSSTLREWETIAPKSEVPQIESFIEFLKNRFQILEAVENANNFSSKNNNSKLDKTSNDKKLTNKHFQRKIATYLATSSVKCYLCEGEHPIYRCKRFLDESSEGRRESIRNLNICNNCLTRHTDKKCKFKGCKKCGELHNTLLHPSEPQPSTSISTHTAVNSQMQILLSTAIINIIDNSNNPIAVRALLDSGSQSNFITEQLAHKLRKPMKIINCSIHGVDGSISKSSNSITATVKSIKTSYHDVFEFLTLPSITSNLPAEKFNISKAQLPCHIDLADPSYSIPGKIDVLIGADSFYDLLGEGTYKYSPKSPIFKETKLGWVVSGPVQIASVKEIHSFCIQSQRIEEQISKFWKLEECPSHETLSLEEKNCVTHFNNTVERKTDGRFVVRLPFVENRHRLGDSRGNALRRFLALEKRLQTNDEQKKSYIDFMEEYLRLGHMEKVPSTAHQAKDEMYFLPHHAVYKSNSATTKVRVVFDASCQSNSGSSLNDVLLKGPTMQQDLICIVARFCTYRYAISADIAKMYRQIWMDERDQNFQKILWRSNPEEPIQEYRLKTITYGTKPASFLATACLKKLAEEETGINSLAYQAIVYDFYMDDLLSGADSIENAKRLRDDVTNILLRAGFVLRKWISNEYNTLRDMANVDNDPMQILDLNGRSKKTLGLSWNPIYDTYNYEVNDDNISNNNNTITKRTVLSTIATLFDPLGLIGPVIMKAKLIMQSLWRLMIDWDDSLPADIKANWIAYSNELRYLNNIKIPRRIIPCVDSLTIQIHGFSDASTCAYGACLYLRVTDTSGKHYCRLIVAKSRIAPLKTISVPRLELCAAVLLVRLARKIIPELRLNISQKYFWTDSTIVLAWIGSESSCWKTFVAHRVGEIQESTLLSEWRHVDGAVNPADVISRGCNPSQLQQSEIWWNGPP